MSEKEEKHWLEKNLDSIKQTILAYQIVASETGLTEEQIRNLKIYSLFVQVFEKPQKQEGGKPVEVKATDS